MPIDGRFELMALPYAAEALEPVISANTLAFHHGKHLAAYVNNLNAALSGSGLEGLPLEDVVLNKADNMPSGALADAIDRDFGSFEAFKEAFAKAGATLFGSGWAWLSADGDGKLVITQEPNAANPIQRGLRPLMTMDVWEHAYYLDYQNRRPDHLAALWQIIDWDIVAVRYQG